MTDRLSPDKRALALATIGWSLSQLARRTGWHKRTIMRWMSDPDAAVPLGIDDWLMRNADRVLLDEPPQKPAPKGTQSP